MNILVLGKFPPLQGGVSAAVYSAALEAAAAGHTVTVVTNSNLAESTNRIMVDTTRPLPMSVRVLYCAPPREREFIPWVRPDLSELIGLALRASEDNRPDFVVGWYFEPYGIAAAYVGHILEVPFCLVHAGSDAGRLSRHHPNLRSAYRSAIRKSAFVVTTESLAARELRDLQIVPRQIVETAGPPVRVPAASRAELRRSRDSLFNKLCFEFDFATEYASASPRLASALSRFGFSVNKITAEDLVIGIFGKIHPKKGHFALVDACVAVLHRGLCSFRLAICLSGDEYWVSRLLNYIADQSPELIVRVMLFPIVHPDLMPDVLGSCDVVCHLDQDFPIDFHSPRLIREALAAGAAVVCTAEAVAKSIPAPSVSLKHILEVWDTVSHPDGLADRLMALVEEPGGRLRGLQMNARHYSSRLEPRIAGSGTLVVLANRIAALAADS